MHKMPHEQPEASKTNSISQPHWAKSNSLQPRHLPCNICYCVREAMWERQRGWRSGPIYLGLALTKKKKKKATSIQDVGMG